MVVKTSFRDSLEWPKNSTPVIFTVGFITMSGYRSKSVKGKGTWGHVWNIWDTNVCGIMWDTLYTFILLAMKYGNTYRILQTKELPWSLLSRVFTGDESCGHLVPMWMISAFKSSTQVLTINHIVSIIYLINLVQHGPGPQASKNSHQIEYS